MNWRSVWAVVAGMLVGIAATTLIDVALHVAGVYPPIDRPIDDALAFLASSYRLIIGIGCAWLAARLAPARPMRHALALGALGATVALAGVIATWNLGLGPRWYPISLVILAMPQSWVGAKVFERQARLGARPVTSGRPGGPALRAGAGGD
jgi:hypothetical protein